MLYHLSQQRSLQALVDMLLRLLVAEGALAVAARSRFYQTAADAHRYLTQSKSDVAVQALVNELQLASVEDDFAVSVLRLFGLDLRPEAPVTSQTAAATWKLWKAFLEQTRTSLALSEIQGEDEYKVAALVDTDMRPFLEDLMKFQTFVQGKRLLDRYEIVDLLPGGSVAKDTALNKSDVDVRLVIDIPGLEATTSIKNGNYVATFTADGRAVKSSDLLQELPVLFSRIGRNISMKSKSRVFQLTVEEGDRKQSYDVLLAVRVGGLINSFWISDSQGDWDFYQADSTQVPARRRIAVRLCKLLCENHGVDVKPLVFQQLLEGYGSISPAQLDEFDRKEISLPALLTLVFEELAKTPSITLGLFGQRETIDFTEEQGKLAEMAKNIAERLGLPPVPEKRN